ncbi:MAG: hypothetical protein EBU46_17185, partial [Nitrosomonadaceae bacterium]|nr:hypothetical protein [Nitrosomonadaceae bacterium]
MTDIEKLICLIDEVKYTSRNAIGVDEFEPQLVQLLAFIKAHQELRPNVVHNFQLMIQDGSFGPYTIIEFCMHELRWQEMRSEIEKFYLIRKDKIL